jgi:hypothetical protein
MWIAGNLTIRITRVLNADADKTGGLEKTEGNQFDGIMDSVLGSFSSLINRRCDVIRCLPYHSHQ